MMDRLMSNLRDRETGCGKFWDFVRTLVDFVATSNGEFSLNVKSQFDGNRSKVDLSLSWDFRRKGYGEDL